MNETSVRTEWPTATPGRRKVVKSRIKAKVTDYKVVATSDTHYHPPVNMNW